MGLEKKFGSILLYHVLKHTSRRFVRTAVNLSFKILGDNSTEDEPPIVLLHGLLSSKSEWKGLGKTIANVVKKSVVVVDLRNHGGSPYTNSQKYEEMAEDLIQLFDKLEIESASIVGHSLGGRTAMYVALTTPKRVKSLVLVDISPISTAPQFTEMESILKTMEYVDFSKAKNYAAAIETAEKHLRNRITDDSIMGRIISNVVKKRDGTFGFSCNAGVLAEQFKYFETFPRRFLKEKIKYLGPCLFLGGQLSDHIPPDDLPLIRELFPVSVVAYIPKTGHYVYVEDQKTFLGLTIDFLKTGE